MGTPFSCTLFHLRHVSLFLHLSGNTQEEAREQLVSTYGESVSSFAVKAEWLHRFAEKNSNIEDPPRSGPPMEVDLDTLRDAVEAYPYVTTRDLKDTSEVAQGTIVERLTTIG